MIQLANSIQIGIKYLIFQKIIFPAISQRSSSSGIFAFGKTSEAAKSPGMHHEKVLGFNPHCLFLADGNAERPNYCNRAASLVRYTQLAFEDNMLRPILG